MSKITIYCIILAVCINFEGIQGNLLGNPLGSLLNNVQKQLSDKLQDAIAEGTGILNNVGKDMSNLGTKIGNDLIENQLDEDNGVIKPASILTCVKVPGEARTVINELKSIFNTCVSSEFQTANDDIQTLTKLIKDVEKIISDKIQQIISQSSGNIIADIQRIIKELEDLVNQLLPDIDKAVTTIIHFLSNLPKFATCFESSYTQSVQQDVRNLINDAKDCYQSITNTFVI